VIDVASGDVLALASYPAYAYGATAEDFARLRSDTRWLPLRFRAVSDAFPPGSTCKAITLVAGLSDRVIRPGDRIHCRGAFLPGRPTQFRCWIYNQYGITHDSELPEGQRGEDAIRNSCNIYFYEVGGRLGAERLCDWFDAFGFGRLQGTGLIEESPGIVPHERWLRQIQGRGHSPSDAWNYAIGQGEVTATPLQAANVAAAVARGRWEPVHVARLPGGEPLLTPAGPAQPFDETALRALRSGMWRVVNERGGTANKHAPLSSPDYELCGKTGSAQVVPRVITTRYVFEWPDGLRETVEARTEAEARARFGPAHIRLVGTRAAQRFPALGEEGRLPAHAWFIGYAQLKATPRGASPPGKAYAIAVLIEFGGSGGSVASPVARQIAELLVGGPVVGLDSRTSGGALAGATQALSRPAGPLAGAESRETRPYAATEGATR
ncbi:MAG TPA: penicillin-binding transpeptidase domain-containing protein, partial [Phycisphaerae bacterium]|nr:penicillin-binding transpeptidase domain-containing protein [Phycisphaerae bacterium]